MRKLLLLLLLCPSLALAQNARYDGVANGPRGPVAGAMVAVCTQPAITSTTPCSTLATLFTSSSGGAKPNPLTADAVGNFNFYATPALYTIQVYGPWVQSPSVQTDVAVGTAAPGKITCPATINAYNLSSMLFVDGVKYATIEQAVAALPANGRTVMVPAGYVAAISSPAVYPPNTHIVFLGGGNTVTCNTGSNPCIQFNGGQSSIDGFSPVILAGSFGNGTIYRRGTSTGPIFLLDWVSPTNANIFNNALKNFTIDDASGSGDAILARSFYYLTLEHLYIFNAQGNGYRFQDDKPGSTNSLLGRFLLMKNVYYTADGGTGIGLIFDSSNGNGISEVHGDNLHCDMPGAQQCAKFVTTGVRQNAQMTFDSWTIFDVGSTYAFQFDSPTSSVFSTVPAA
jgi:hypothetical protein